MQVFDVTAVRNALESRLKSLESELHQVCHLCLPVWPDALAPCAALFTLVPLPVQVERLQRKFAMIHSTLAQQQNPKPGPDTPRMQSSHSQAENLAKVGAQTCDLCVPLFARRVTCANNVTHALQVVQAAQASKLAKKVEGLELRERSVNA